ncbi:MAG: sigma 54-interacting transcriptional regulator [Deltaproteobacteria bacterium]|nr:sigma 54-interacting transcriptional regulator [Deltaproteobacteria bacterium]
MAVGLLRALGPATGQAQSAGLEAGALSPAAVRVMAEAGIDIAGHVSRDIAALETQTFDVVVTVGEKALAWVRQARTVVPGEGEDAARSRHPLVAGMPLRLHWDVGGVDPGLEGAEADAACRAIRDRLRQLGAALMDQGCLPSFARERDHLERLLDSLEEGIIVHDEGRRLYLINRAAERITGRPREEVLGRDCREVFPPDGLCGQQCATCRGPGLPTERCDYATTFARPDGESRRLRITVSPVVLDDDGGRGVLITLRDDTEVESLRWRLRTSRSFHGMIGTAPAMLEVFETIRQAAVAEYPVLVSGESGTGKELVANAIHNESRRQGGPFVPVSCGALPETILESELFGHVRGAFTGAIREKKGRFELADGGTLFLDEIGELSSAMQVKLLRVLQEKRFEKVGGERTIQVDVRIIAATNRDLRAAVKAGAFREDLYYRLAVVPIHLPPLRERKEDIPFLVEQILSGIRQEYAKPIRGVSDEAMDRLFAHPWPGNVRELINALQFASVRCPAEVILATHLPLDVRRGSEAAPAALVATAAPDAGEDAIFRRTCKLDRAAVDAALQRTGGNKVQAARLLGVGRATLYRFLKGNPAP